MSTSSWERAALDQKCGRCGQRIYRGQPMLQIAIPALSRPLRRCLQCAGEPVPADLPPLVDVQMPITPTLKRGRSAPWPFASAAGLAAVADFKRKAGNDDE